MLRNSARARIAVVLISTVSLTLTLIPNLSASAQSAAITHVTIPEKKGYVPHPPAGSTDQYRCTFFNPHFTSDRMAVASQFHNGTREVHHMIAYLVEPNTVAQVRALDPKNKGWACFASPLGATSMGNLSALPWLAGWSPGHGRDTVPAGYGVAIPAGSGIIMQIHYNALAGTKRDNSYLNLTTVAAAGSNLTPLTSMEYVAAPDLPCPSGVTGPLCNHDASVADLATRFGASAAQFTHFLETVCNHNQYPADASAPGATSATCTLPLLSSTPVTVHGVTPHMHMLGVSFSVDICSHDAKCTTPTNLLTVPNYSFDNQIGYRINPVTLSPGDFVRVTCTYNPSLRRFNPQTKKLPPRYITWGDGSSDEMCLATLWTSPGVS